jgi:hypothetical protein
VVIGGTSGLNEFLDGVERRCLLLIERALIMGSGRVVAFEPLRSSHGKLEGREDYILNAKVRSQFLDCERELGRLVLLSLEVS